MVARRLEGKLVKIVIGHYPAFSLEQARKESEKYLQAFDRGEDPREIRDAEQAAKRAVRAETVSMVTAEWMKRDQADKRGFKAVERLINNRVIPAWGNRPITSITKKDCIAFVNEYADSSSKVTSNRIFSMLHRFFKWTLEQDILPFSPMNGMKKLGQENQRTRVLSDEELTEIWKATDLVDGDPRRPNHPLKTNQFSQTSPIWGPIFKLLILTGARREEIGGLRWNEVNLDKGFILLPGNRTKRLPKHKDQSRTIFLSKKAVEILKALPHLKTAEGVPAFVFTETGYSSVSGWGRAKARMEKLIKETRAKAGITEEMDFWRIHDLRRTAATGFQKLGIRLEVTETVLGHTSGSRGGIVGVYQLYDFKKEAIEAVEIWADHVTELVAEKVVNFPAEKIS